MHKTTIALLVIIIVLAAVALSEFYYLNNKLNAVLNLQCVKEKFYCHPSLILKPGEIDFATSLQFPYAGKLLISILSNNTVYIRVNTVYTQFEKTWHYYYFCSPTFYTHFNASINTYYAKSYFPVVPGCAVINFCIKNNSTFPVNVSIFVNLEY
ncbi:hypothetical protein DFR86_01530 [Acidianus sulfidivorans JP7]|uniref:Uncharacterized protein n=1 Tax=Acidianus sulfidivorans JP7 TaxID=619593 RepID=A0A2U9IJY8_9CREN|nr:hypothetical protein [Acidianus sulfidivorans]AWR96357.1 hypothetical protein DFR86_01530 [Acidianus sulfidivorans JP7]